MTTKHFLTLNDLSKNDALSIFDKAIELKKSHHIGQSSAVLNGKTLAMIFEKSSMLRTCEPGNTTKSVVLMTWEPGNIGKPSILMTCEPGNTETRSILMTWEPGNTEKRVILMTWERGNTGEGTIHPP